MALRSSRQRQRDLREFGEHIRRWRQLNGLSASELADRASVTRQTLRTIEQGAGTARLDSVFAVLAALGITDAVVGGANPFNNDAARARMDDIMSGGGNP